MAFSGEYSDTCAVGVIRVGVFASVSGAIVVKFSTVLSSALVVSPMSSVVGDIDAVVAANEDLATIPKSNNTFLMSRGCLKT